MLLDDLPHPLRPTTSVGAGANSLAEMFLRRVQQSPRRCAWRRKQDGRWLETPWQEVREKASAVASWLLERDMDLGDKMLVVGSTRAEWCLCDMGGQLAGLVTIGAYPTLSADQLAYVIDHSDSRVIFVEGAEGLERVREIRSGCPKLEQIVVWDMEGIDPGDDVVAFSEVCQTEVDEEKLVARRSAIERDSVAIIVYTSGTTGPPKGAMLTHANILTFVGAGLGIEFDEDDEGLTFLPMAHVAERIASFYTRMSHGVGSAFASSIPAVLEEVKEVRPTLFGSVPRIFEKAYDKIQGQVDKAPPLRRSLFRWAENVGLDVVDRWQKGEPVGLLLRLRYGLADRIVFRKIREAFGGRVRFFVTGAAPIPPRVLRFFWAVGFPIFEAYGQTESTVITHTNRPGATRLGSVGLPLDCVEQRLADDGEVLIKSGLVFGGYHKNETATREAIDDEGWLHTGDIGRIDGDGFLFIVDRKKHIIITAGGKNITPANIENEIKAQDPFISQVHAHGDRRPYISAMITLSAVESIEWAQGQGMVAEAEATRMKTALMENPLARPKGLDALLAEVGEHEEIRERIVEAVKRGNAKLSRVEAVKRVTVLDRELSLAEGEITPTLKVKRKNIEKRFAERLDRLYDDDDFGLTIERRRS